MARHRGLRAILGILIALSAGCMNAGGRGNMNGPLSGQQGGDDGQALANDLGNVLDRSGADNGLTPADKTGLKNLAAETGKDKPKRNTSLPPDAAKQARQLAAAAAQGKDVSADMAKLAGVLLSSCAQNVAGLAPRPGMTLLGIYSGKFCGGPYYDGWAVNVQVSTSDYSSYTATGASSQFADLVSGPLQVNADGTASFVGQTVDNGYGVYDATTGQVTDQSQTVQAQCLFTDQPQAAVEGCQFSPWITNDSNFGTCQTGLQLVSSANPIPDLYNEAMAELGECFRQALVLLSPAMEKMMGDLDPTLAAFLQQRMLGMQ